MLKKKTLALFLSFTLLLGVTSCKKEEDSTPKMVETVATVATTETTEAVPETSETEPAPVELEDPLYDPSIPFLVNPITGVQDMDPANEGNRSVGVVINNCAAALPQRGVSQADAIYEYETEGGQTRLLAMFADVNSIPEMGSLRSARIVASDLCASTNSIFIHYGRNARVPDHIAKYGIDHIDGNNCSAGSYSSKNYEDGYVPLSGGLFFWRDSTWLSQRALEHTAVSDGRHIAEGIEHYGIDLKGESPFLFNFVADNSIDIAERGEPCSKINVYFSATNDDALFTYDPETNLYYKSQYEGKAQIDETTGEQIAVTNVVVLFCHVLRNADGYTLDYYLQDGTGALYISNGKLVQCTYEKKNPNDPIKLYNLDGEEIEVNRGKSYICAVNSDRVQLTTWEG